MCTCVHELIHTSQRPFICTTCDKAFAQASNLRAHELIHTGQRPFICTTCDKAFAQASNLRVHERMHTGQRSFICQTCGKGFKHSGSLYNHKHKYCRQARGVAEMRHMEQITCLVYVYCECGQMSCNRLDI